MRSSPLPLAARVALASLALACRGADARRTDAPRADAARAEAPRDAASPAADDSRDAARSADGAPLPDARDVAPDAGGPPTAFACLAAHYAGRAALGASGWALELPGGARIPYDDGRAKRTADRIASPDIEDTFALGYPTGAIAPVTDPEDDPGRVRVEPLFRATYGASEREVSSALVPVKLAGKTVRFHRRAAPALERVGARLEALLGDAPALGRFLRVLGGTFASRPIAGTERTSAHAWGIAIDIDTSQADYWRSSPKPGWRNRIPQAIVDAFEAEGFVWGGRWFHYDTMHFEYRPELFDGRCRAPRPGR